MNPDIQNIFCPKCGKPSETPGLCTQCRIESTPWYTCDNRVTSIHCPSCGATKVGNTWTDSDRQRSDLAPEIAKSAVHLRPEVRKPAIEVSVDDMTVNRSRANLVIRGSLYNKPVEGTCSVEIIWHKEQCDRCNRISGSYYEGIVQVRADGRIPSVYEIQTASSIAEQVEDSLQSGGERLSFISDMQSTRDGLDIIVGSQHIGALISQKIIAELGGRYTTHPKLVGEKNGRQLFRITYSVRLPRYQKYDIVVVKNKYFEVQGVESRLRAIDLSDGASKSIREDDVERTIGNSRNAESGLVVFTDNSMVGILDPVSNKTRECRRPKWLDIRNGQYLQLLRDGEQIIIVG
jgi:nonsense-mediated mRNA decay protein 3